ncbi:DUF1128 domain-containing protein [Salisediminibacterium selenitireducens]|uniref:UPF0435 protein Bsel_1714 n=1 Tax=Bacillus selenitireducens (strain ATCC 700615 / DSM 15326 / MLS10) TaxID=439292 RepID=D6XTT6_BACIE|nr:DUF1128 domain-containing protein [Salisediminibacterium selenitireducens]ADH99222.1 protein of unknown function DUF1128 [[Bacillus] selenitireducens MLS10]
MSQEDPRREELSRMIEEIKRKLQIVNGAAIKAESFSLNKYDEIEEIYEMVISKPSFSVSEMDAIVSELGQMRDRKPEA